jgi:hypothetical protein
VRLCGSLPNGGTISTNFTVVVSPADLKDVDVVIDKDVTFHIKESAK